MKTIDIYPTEWTKNKVVYEVNLRQYTPEGNIKAFLPHIPRLKKMGVDILWFMPIHPIGKKNRKGNLGSPYSVQNYTAVNPDYGSFDDFKNMVTAIHDNDMYIIIDWVANHAAWDNIWTTTNPDFFSRDSSGEFMCRVKDWSDVIDFDYSNPEMRKALIEAMIFWVKEANIDGFRCDVAMMVPTDFWEEARKQLNKIKAIFMLAEAEEAEHHFCSFDASYSWEILHAFTAVAKGEKTAQAIIEQYKQDLTKFPLKSYRLRFITNHDENTWNGSEFERLGDAADAFMILCYTIPGMPLIYSGQESALNKKLSFFDKDLIDWGYFKKQSFFTVLNKLKHKHECLWNGLYGGDCVFAEVSNGNILAYARYKHSDIVITIINLSAHTSEAEIKLPTCFAGIYTEYFKGSKLNFSGKANIKLNAWEYSIFVINT